MSEPNQWQQNAGDHYNRAAEHLSQGRLFNAALEAGAGLVNNAFDALTSSNLSPDTGSSQPLTRYQEGVADGYAEGRYPQSDGGKRIEESRASLDSEYADGVRDGYRSGDGDRSDFG